MKGLWPRITSKSIGEMGAMPLCGSFPGRGRLDALLTPFMEKKKDRKEEPVEGIYEKMAS